LKNDRDKKSCGLAEGIHQLVDRAVQVLVASAQSVDLVDRMQGCGVVLAAELSIGLLTPLRGPSRTSLKA
jgi:hypothetical protein